MQTTNTSDSKKQNPHKYKIACLLPALILFFSFSQSFSCLAAGFEGKLKTVSITDSDGSNLPPSAVINFSKDGGMVYLDANGSSDPDGNLVSYAWEFGDGTTGEGVTVSHQLTIDNPSVTLTVIDNRGGVALSQIVIGTSGIPWSLQYVNSEELNRVFKPATNAFDGDPNTIWHTEWKTLQSSHPHEIQINLGAVYSINGLRYLPRQDGGINGTIAQYEFYVSQDGINWANPVAQGTFAGNTSEKEVLFSTTNAQFIRLVALSAIDGGAWASIAELSIVNN